MQPHAALKYRPEIDGLRAIAVLSVVFYHANLTWNGANPFAGGFIGVDIFFVISGYLITTILLRDMQLDQFSLLHFYERRARRILPALFLVMGVSLPFAFLLMLPKALSEYLQSIIASTLFSSNILFWLQDSYTAEPSIVKPFLHTWSLSVEEQYYVFFPMLLLISWMYARRFLVPLFITGLIGSLALAEWGSRGFPDAAFFLLPTRMWELLAGGLLAKLEIKTGRIARPQFNSIMPVVGLLLTIGAMVFYNEQTTHPVFYVAAAVGGVMLLIWFCGKSDLATRLLSSKFFVAIGLISYSLYLWHQPVFAFARLRTGNLPKESEMLGFIALCVGLAYLSWRFVEKPFRNKKKISTQKLWPVLGVSAIGLTILCGAGLYHMGLPKNLPPIAARAMLAQKQKPDLVQDGKKCIGRIVADACLFGKADAKTAWTIVGDSHLDNLTASFWKMIDHNTSSLAVLTMNSCHYAVGAEILFNGRPKFCTPDVNEERRDYLKIHPNNIAIIGGRLPLYLSKNYFDNQEGGVETGDTILMRPVGQQLSDDERKEKIGDLIVRSVEGLLQSGHKVVVIYPIPEVGWRVPETFVQRIPKNFSDIPLWVENEGITTSYDVFKERTREAYAVYNRIMPNKNLIRIYPEKIFCNTGRAGRCLTHDSNDVFYTDDDHLSLAGSALIVDAILREAKTKWNL
ncbi:MAG: acyltransferase family protein [Pseudomonadota bacterium]